MVVSLVFSGRYTSFSDCKLLYAAAAAPTYQQETVDDLKFVEIHIIL